MRKLQTKFETFRSNSALLGELKWIAFEKVVQFGLQLVALKILSAGLGKRLFGEYSLILSGLAFAGFVLILPLQSTFLRNYHAAVSSGELEKWNWFSLRWLLFVALLLIAITSLTWPRLPGRGQFLVLCALAFFLSNYVRIFGVVLLNIQRLRKSVALQSVGYLFVQFALFCLVVLWLPVPRDNLPGFVLLASSFSASIFLFFGFRAWLRSIGSNASASHVEIRRGIFSYGVPCGLLMMLQWVQSFSDRYVLASQVSVESAGHFVAVFQVCGFPFMMTWFVMEALITPIIFSRARDAADESQLWEAMKVILLAVASFLFCGVLGFFGFLLFGKRLLVLLTSHEFVVSTPIILILSLARFFQCLSFVLDLVFQVRKKIFISFSYRFISAVTSVPILIFCTRSWGFRGAVYGALLIHGCYLFMQLFAPGGCFLFIVRTRRAALRQARSARL